MSSCVFIIQRKTVNNREKITNNAFLFFFFCREAGRETNFCESRAERESTERKKEAMIKFLMGGKISFSFSRHNIESSVIEHIRT